MLGQYSKEDGKKLLLLARKSIEEEFTKKKPELPEEKQFNQARGVFVTLHKILPLQKVAKESGVKPTELRGCIGFPYPNLSIKEAVYLASKQAAFSDYRFSKVKKEEMEDIKIEISILTVPEECEVKDIFIGKDGLICNYLGYQGLLLPQVASENKFNKLQFLECLCDKAGLPRNTWQSKNFKLFRFQCQIFSE